MISNKNHINNLFQIEKIVIYLIQIYLIKEGG